MRPVNFFLLKKIILMNRWLIQKLKLPQTKTTKTTYTKPWPADYFLTDVPSRCVFNSLPCFSFFSHSLPVVIYGPKPWRRTASYIVKGLAAFIIRLRGGTGIHIWLKIRCLSGLRVRFPPQAPYGRVAERPMAAVLKTAGGKPSLGSNPSPAAVTWCCLLVA